jgi:hypothetical protein
LIAIARERTFVSHRSPTPVKVCRGSGAAAEGVVLWLSLVLVVILVLVTASVLLGAAGFLDFLE